MTCSRRLRDWQQAKVWDRLHEVLLARLHAAGQLDWSHAAVDSSMSARRKGELTGASPVDRGRPGSKHHLLVDGAGIPLVVAVSAANRHNLGLLLPLVRTVPPVRGKRGRPRQRPDCMVADRGYDSRAHCEALRVLGIRPLLAARGSPHGSGLGVWRWPVERSFAWLHWYRRLRIRWEYRADIHHALLKLACSLICYRALTRSF